MRNLVSWLFLFLLSVLFSCGDRPVQEADWAEYLGGPDRNHYTHADQINLSNIKDLKIAWEYHSGDSGQIQCNPIIIDGVLYGMTASTQPFALDAATGREIWRNREAPSQVWYSTSRGVVLWRGENEKRLLYTKESWLYALDAATGKPILTFGDSGRVSLRAGLGATARDKFVISNTPGTIFEDKIIMPLRVSEGSDAAPGYIQAFNVKSGKVEWVFKTIPHPGEDGYNTWPEEAYKNASVGAANNWSGMAVDRERGIVFVPTGSAAFDFYGGDRKGENLFANTLLALDARTGKKIWHFQMVHHDILDRDPPAPPNLITVTHEGRRIDAVAQVTKQGFVFVFDRESGKPLFEIKETPVPASDVPGEEAWPTQPIPVKPAPYARQTFTADDISPYASNKDSLLATLRSARGEGAFTPLSRGGSIVFPGLDGGAEWGGAAADPDGILYVNSNEMPWKIALHEDDQTGGLLTGPQLYIAKCAACHGANRQGNLASGFPTLVNIKKKYHRAQLSNIVTKGKGMMPAFKSLTDDEIKNLIGFLFDEAKDKSFQKGRDDKKEVVVKADPTRWKISGYTKFLDADGYPAVAPPWGTLNAIDLNTGEYVWKIVYGETPEFAEKRIPQTGSESYGGPVITAGGLLFIAGTKDKKIRAYNKKTGELLWETMLPAAGFATPSTYVVSGKQYVVIACGGTKLGASKGDSYVAFALPDNK
jgi:quinoprotein glucose dehydrogenase